MIRLRLDCMLILRFLLLLSVLSPLAVSQRNGNGRIKQCCPKDVLIKPNRKCADNSKIMPFNCSTGVRILLDPHLRPEDTFYIDDENGTLHSSSDGMEILYNEFCHNQMEHEDGKVKEIAVVCVSSASFKDDFKVPPYTTGTMKALATMEFISAIFLLMTVAVYIAFPELRDVQGICILHFAANLAFTYIVLGLLQYSGHFQPYETCVVKAYVLYFFSLCMFFWLNLASFNLWKTARGWQTEEKKTRKVYYATGYGIPFLLLTTALLAQSIPGSHPKPDFGHFVCWFKEDKAKWLYHYTPMTVLLFLNVAYFLDTGRILCNVYSKPTQFNRARALRHKLVLYFKLFLVMGISWQFEILSVTILVNFPLIVLITDIINCLQGLIIFTILVLTRKRVLRLLLNRKILCIDFLPGNLKQESETEEDEEDEDNSYEMHTRTPAALF